tara:strand:- start:520 stop:687 length:168 start_codon:yes stop_codon:yes gene_type:complete
MKAEIRFYLDRELQDYLKKDTVDLAQSDVDGLLSPPESLHPNGRHVAQLCSSSRP